MERGGGEGDSIVGEQTGIGEGGIEEVKTYRQAKMEKQVRCNRLKASQSTVVDEERRTHVCSKELFFAALQVSQLHLLHSLATSLCCLESGV